MSWSRRLPPQAAQEIRRHLNQRGRRTTKLQALLRRSPLRIHPLPRHHHRSVHRHRRPWNSNQGRILHWRKPTSPPVRSPFVIPQILRTGATADHMPTLWRSSGASSPPAGSTTITARHGGATWWRDLPPCYNSNYDYATMAPAHQRPPTGWVDDESTHWEWGDGSMTLDVQVF